MRNVTLRTALICLTLLVVAGRCWGDDALDRLLKEAEQLPRASAAGRMVSDRELARAMIAYGKRSKTPDVIILGVQILTKNAVDPITPTTSEQQEKAELVQLIDEALRMRPDDESLVVLAERAADALQETTRGLAGGPKRWTVTIPKGKFYQLDPSLVYNAQEKAIVTAHADGVMLGASIRRSDQQTELKRAVGRGKVNVEWNSGIHTTGWDVRIYNLTSADDAIVNVETN